HRCIPLFQITANNMYHMAQSGGRQSPAGQKYASYYSALCAPKQDSGRFCRANTRFCQNSCRFFAKSKKKLLHFPFGFAMIVQLLKGGASRMAKCACCGKGVTFGIKVSHSHRRSNRTWNPNVKRVKAIVDGSPKYIYACTRCLRSGKVTRAV